MQSSVRYINNSIDIYIPPFFAYQFKIVIEKSRGDVCRSLAMFNLRENHFDNNLEREDARRQPSFISYKRVR